LVPVSPSPERNLAGTTGNVPDSLHPVPDLDAPDLEHRYPETQYLVPDVDLPSKDLPRVRTYDPEANPIPDLIPK
jgi:hypothetical protein